jgi:hypothetical protein
MDSMPSAAGRRGSRCTVCLALCPRQQQSGRGEAARLCAMLDLMRTPGHTRPPAPRGCAQPGVLRWQSLASRALLSVEPGRACPSQPAGSRHSWKGSTAKESLRTEKPRTARGERARHALGATRLAAAWLMPEEQESHLADANAARTKHTSCPRTQERWTTQRGTSQPRWLAGQPTQVRLPGAWERHRPHRHAACVDRGASRGWRRRAGVPRVLESGRMAHAHASAHSSSELAARVPLYRLRTQGERRDKGVCDDAALRAGTGT